MGKFSHRKRIFLSPPHVSGKEMKFVAAAFKSNYVAPFGPDIDAFEKEFSQKTGITHALALSSGTAAIHLALRVLGVQAQDEVIASSLTFIGSVSPVTFQNAIPVFIDSDRESWNMNPDLLAEEIEYCREKGKLPKAVISTDIYGQCADLDRITKICSKYDIPVIADSSEALGATYKGRSAGKAAKLAVFSFNGNKIITTSGGGMLASDDSKMIDYARFLSSQARDPAAHYEHSQIGYNYRLSNILAAIGRAQLKVLEDRVKARRRIFNFYKEALSSVAGIGFMPEVPYGTSNRWLTVITIDPNVFGVDRDDVRIELEKLNIEARPVWKPMHLQPVFKGARIRGGMVCEDIFRRGLCLPSGSAMSKQDMHRVVDAIMAVAQK